MNPPPNIQMQSECNLDQLAELIFKHHKKDKGSIELGIDPEQVNEITNGNFEKYMYSILIELFKLGTKILYNIDNPLTLTKTQVENISEYFYAINYSIFITANQTDNEPWTLLQQNQTLTSIEVHFKKI
ncbi:hypothetical protein SAGO17_0057 [Mimivirus AB-566-O17]|uniref:Uncharacterized protein n=1 Tax=Mimivirus AB-566-O17 TaxID=1988039 RepID=A0A1X9VNT7_9VIRU|nr:hypothetical protein SAGO17_0057 [Mimivirus AB-566-O17]